jgi:hypothetical protein
MSLESGWYSTMFPVIVLIGQILSTFAFLILLLSRFEKQEPFSRVVTAKHFHDLGNLLLAFVIFYTYISFSQLLIIYSGNMPRETEWYLHRIAGGWKWIVGLLAIFHFFVPFFLLLLRTTKRHAERLKVIGAIIFCVHSLAIYWVIVPTFYPDGLHVSWLDFAAWLGVGGIWFSRFAAGMKQYALLPQNDPRIEYAVGAMAHAK